MSQHNSAKIVIVGGGTAGWMSAASLSRHYGSLVNIEVVASDELPGVGVGEATIPTLRQFYHQLGLSDREVMAACGATCKLGIEFIDWRGPGQSFFHPFGMFGQDVGGIGFHHLWLKARKLFADEDIGRYSLPVQLARAGRFTLPARRTDSPLSLFDWALHLDAGRFARLLQRQAQARRVSFHNGRVTAVHLHPDNGEIQSLQLADGSAIEADLFIDCSGFSALLVEKALHEAYEDWSHWLGCDRAVVVQARAEENPLPYTRARAREAGWSWDIPLQERRGLGYVYSSAHCTNDVARENLLAAENPLNEARLLRFRPGRRRQAWSRNCIALGLSAGFIEPLESTSIALIQTGIERIQTLLGAREIAEHDCGRRPFSEALRQEFNSSTAAEYERVRDFIICHYYFNGRNDSAFWRDQRQLSLPESLRHKLAVYHRSGHFVNQRWEIFHAPSWIAVLFGLQCFPDHYDSRVDQLMQDRDLEKSLDKIRRNLSSAVADTYTHSEFLQQHILAQDVVSEAG